MTYARPPADHGAAHPDWRWQPSWLSLCTW